MSDFGFTSLVQQNQPNLLDMIQQAKQRSLLNQTEQANLNQALYQQQRQRSLADLVSQNAGGFQSPLGRSLAQAGFGQEAMEADQRSLQQQQLAQNIAQIHRNLMVSKAGMVQTPEQAEAFINNMSQEGKDAYGFTGDEQGQDALSAVHAFRQSSITPEQEAQNEALRGRYGHPRIFNEKNGQTVIFDPLAGTVEPVGSPAPSGPQRSSRVAAPQTAGGGTSADPYAGMKPDQVEKKWKELTDAVSTVKGRANLNAQLQNRLYASQRVKNAALDESGSIKNLDPTMLNEVAAGTASLLANGSAPAEHTVQQFLPKGHGMGQASILEWLTNDPQGANQQGFIKQMVDLSNREENLITNQMHSGQLQAVPNYMGLKKRNEARFNSILQGAGLDPGSIDANGLPIKAAGGGSGQVHTPEQLAAARALGLTHIKTVNGETRGWDDKQKQWVPLSGAPAAVNRGSPVEDKGSSGQSIRSAFNPPGAR